MSNTLSLNPPQPTSTPTPIITHPAHKLLTRAHPTDVATEIFTNKIKKKPLLLTPSTSTLNNRTLRRDRRLRKLQYHHTHSKSRPLSAKEKRSLRIYDLEPNEVRYEIYEGLNELWHGYILEVLGFTRDGKVVGDVGKKVVTQESHGSLIASADFHGMQIEVVRSGDVGKVGFRGIVVRETKGSVVIVMKGDVQRKILKRGTVFRIVVELPSSSSAGAGDREEGETEEAKRKAIFELHGSQLEIRPVDRATRKFKWHPENHV